MRQSSFAFFALSCLCFSRCKSDVNEAKNSFSSYVRTVPEYSGIVDIDTKMGTGILWDKDSNQVKISVIITKEGLVGFDSTGKKYPLEYDIEKLEEERQLEMQNEEKANKTDY